MVQIFVSASALSALPVTREGAVPHLVSHRTHTAFLKIEQKRRYFPPTKHKAQSSFCHKTWGTSAPRLNTGRMSAQTPKWKLQPVAAANVQGDSRHSTYENMSSTDVVRPRKFSHKSKRLACLAKKLESSVQSDDDLHSDNASLHSRKQDTPTRVREIFDLDNGVHYVRFSKEWLNTQFVVLEEGCDDGTEV